MRAAPIEALSQHTMSVEAPPEPVEVLAPTLRMLPTEARNPRTVDIDRLPTLAVLRLINAEDATVPSAVAAALPALADAVDLAVASLRCGGRVHYVGAGTSGRLGALDAAELPPTFGMEPNRFVAHLAGGRAAFSRSVDDVEDHAADGASDLADIDPRDIVVGLTASGRTPYVGGALRTARAAGASTVLVSANPRAPLAAIADVHVGIGTGPEVVAGSTRMKAGTAQKLVLTAFSTAVMVRLGRTYSNLMVNVRASNAKLRQRTVGLLGDATGEQPHQCARVLTAADGDAKVALVMLLAGAEVGPARLALARHGGVVRDALSDL